MSKDKIDDGGGVTPMHNLTIRDYFAAKAMQGMLFGCVGTIGNSSDVSAYAKGHCNNAIVDRAYAIADAMIAARKGDK